MATDYEMIIRCQCLLNNCRISAFPGRVQIKPAENNPSTTKLQASVAALAPRPSEESTFYPGAGGSEIWLQWQKMHAQKGRRMASMGRQTVLPCSRSGSS